jgi:hypothetical protein
MAAVSMAPQGAIPARFTIRRVTWAAAVALFACLAAGLGFVAGQHHQPPGMTLLHGVAHVGIDEASVSVGGQIYGFAGKGNITWADAQGTIHQGDWPACLTPGNHPITIGAVPVTVDGMSWGQVVWVDCRSS